MEQNKSEVPRNFPTEGSLEHKLTELSIVRTIITGKLLTVLTYKFDYSTAPKVHRLDYFY